MTYNRHPYGCICPSNITHFAMTRLSSMSTIWSLNWVSLFLAPSTQISPPSAPCRRGLLCSSCYSITITLWAGPCSWRWAHWSTNSWPSWTPSVSWSRTPVYWFRSRIGISSTAFRSRWHTYSPRCTCSWALASPDPWHSPEPRCVCCTGLFAVCMSIFRIWAACSRWWGPRSARGLTRNSTLGYYRRWSGCSWLIQFLAKISANLQSVSWWNPWACCSTCAGSPRPAAARLII